MHAASSFPYENLVGGYRTFGEYGPIYSILWLVEDTADGACKYHVRVLESGEELDYPCEMALADPMAQ